MSTMLCEVAELVGGRLFGDGATPISRAAVLLDARPGDITLVDSEQTLNRLGQCSASAVIVPHQLEEYQISQIAVDDVHTAFAKVIQHFFPPRRSRRRGVSPAAYVSPTAKIGRDVAIGPGALIDDDVHIGDRSTIHSGARLMAGCQLAEDVVIYPNAVLYEDTIVGPRVIIHAGVVIGA